MKLGKNSTIGSTTKIIFPENLTIGKNSRIDDFCILICKKKLVIGDYVHIAPNTTLRAHEKLIINDYSLISSYVDIYTSIDSIGSKNLISHPLFKKKNKLNKPQKKKIKIGKYCQIGSHSSLFPGANLEDGSVVGAQTIINFTASKWSVYFGNPARQIAKRNSKFVLNFFKHK